MRPHDPNSLRGLVEQARREIVKFADHRDPTGVPKKISFPIVIRDTMELQRFLSDCNKPFVDHLVEILDKAYQKTVR